LGMPDHCRAKLARPQIIFVDPLIRYAGLFAVALDNGAVGGLKELLPAHIQAIDKVPDIHDFLLLESRANLWTKPPVYPTTIEERRRSAFPRGLRAEKPDLSRPLVHM